MARYDFDRAGRLVIEDHSGVEVVLAYDGDDRIADLRAGTYVAQYVHGLGVDDPVELAAAGAHAPPPPSPSASSSSAHTASPAASSTPKQDIPPRGTMFRRAWVFLRGYNRRFTSERALAEGTARLEQPDKIVQSSETLAIDDEAVTVGVYFATPALGSRRGRPDVIVYRVARRDGSIQRDANGWRFFRGIK